MLIDCRYDIIDPMFQKVPEYFEKTKYKNPSDARNGVFQYTKNVEGDLFEYFAANKEDGERFNNIMGGVMMHQTTVCRFSSFLFPISEIFGSILAFQELCIARMRY